ncbi:hypothetical protein Tco_0127724 [Tanacetum coccineum]
MRHDKIAYDMFRGRSPDISYFYVFDCLVHIHNHRDHMGKFDEKANDGFFLGYSLVVKAFRVFNIRRQEMEDTYHVTFSKDDEEISKSSIEAFDPLSTNNIIIQSKPITLSDPLTPSDPITPSNPITPTDPIIPSNESTEIKASDSHHVLNEYDDFESIVDLRLAEDHVVIIKEPISVVKPSPTNISPSAEVFINPHVLQDRWSKEKHIDLVNILGEL